MPEDKGFEQLGDIFKSRRPTKKPPAYEWQDFALRVIDELGIPNFKRGSVFKVCKEMPKAYIEKCMNETKELCRTGEKWKYFFKIVNQK
ncbi:MAG: hypothetical protein WC582_01485 [Patescibacteria group bacterium]|jgi:hypothetical protein